MDEIKTLVPIRKLKTNKLKQIKDGMMPFFYYDISYDTLLIQIVSPETPTIVHYIGDKNVALLYEQKTREIVGIQIEGFKNSFLPQHLNVEKLWSKTIQVKDFGELALVFEKSKPEITREVVEASQSIIEQKNEGLTELLKKSFSESYSAVCN